MIKIRVTEAAMGVVKGEKEIGVFLFAKVPRHGDHVRLPAAKEKEKAPEVIVVAVVHMAFPQDSSFWPDPAIELRVERKT